VLGFAIFGPASDAPRTGWERVVTLAAVLTPLALIALATGAARSLAALRTEAEELRGLLKEAQAGAAPPAEPPVTERLPLLPPTPAAAERRAPAGATVAPAPGGRAALQRPAGPRRPPAAPA